MVASEPDELEAVGALSRSPEFDLERDASVLTSLPRKDDNLEGGMFPLCMDELPPAAALAELAMYKEAGLNSEDAGVGMAS